MRQIPGTYSDNVCPVCFRTFKRHADQSVIGDLMTHVGQAHPGLKERLAILGLATSEPYVYTSDTTEQDT